MNRESIKTVKSRRFTLVKIYTFLCLFFCLCGFNLFSQQYTLEFIDVETLNKLNYPFKTQFKTEKDRDKEINNVFRYYYGKGYLGFSADSIYVDSLHKTMYVFKGESYKWATIKLVGFDERFKARTGFSFNEMSQSPVSIDYIKATMDGILSALENNGYPFAKIYLDNIVFEDTKLSADMVIDKDVFIKVDEIIVDGNANISLSYLYSFLNISRGNSYNEEKIRAIDKKLENLSFIRLTKSTGVLFYDSLCSITIHAERRNANNFDGILGIIPDELTGKIVLTGDVKLKLMNAFGHAEEVEANWKRFQDNSQKLFLNISYPYLFSLPIGVDYSIDLLRKDTTYTSVTQTAGLRYFLGGFDYLRFYGDFMRSYLLSDPVNLTVMPNFADVNTTLFGMAWHRESYDFRLTPTRGYGINTSIAGGNRIVKPHPMVDENLYEDMVLKSQQYRINLKTRIFAMPVKKHVMLGSAYGGYISGAHFFENELYRIGGLNTLRGFDEESIYASLYGILALEYRFMLERNSFINLFWNGAYYENNNAVNRVIDRPYGFGAGISFETRQGIFSINYALGKQFDNPIMFRNAKIHFGLINSF